MKAHVSLNGIREIRTERGMRRLILGKLGLRCERKVAELARAIGQFRAIEGILPAKLGQLSREPLPLRVTPLRGTQSFERPAPDHRRPSLPARVPGFAAQIGL